MGKFLWGVATSAFQIEGDIENDFTDWERDGKFKVDGLDPVYENGSNHWDFWETDFEYLKELNVNSYRFSIEWARIEPVRNEYSLEAIRQYHKMIDKLIEIEIEPIITLHHFTHPTWFHSLSPWTEKSSIEIFSKFAKKMIDEFADKVKYWITFNEPQVWALAAYGDAKFPPGQKDLYKVMDALYNILYAHIYIYDMLKNYDKTIKVGIAKHFIIFKWARNFFIDKSLVNKLHEFFNVMILDAFKKNELQFIFPLLLNFTSYIPLDNKIDFWGINYYYRLHAKFKMNYKNPMELFAKEPSTDMGWEIYPKGLKKIIKLVSTTNKEILITENGIATEDENLRIKFIKKHLKVVKSQMKKNKLLKGYFYWSLLDNYEWLQGKSKRFGLIHVDYNNNFTRKLKPAAKIYSELITKINKRS
jgi:beta-glucosidase